MNGILCILYLYIGGYFVCMILNDDGMVIVIGIWICFVVEDDGGDIEYWRFYLLVIFILICIFGLIMFEEILYGVKFYC